MSYLLDKKKAALRRHGSERVSRVNVTGKQQFTPIGFIGAACLIGPAMVSVVTAFQQQASIDSYMRTISLNGTMNKMGLAGLDTHIPMGAPISIYAISGAVMVVGLVLVLVGRETVYQGNVYDN